MLQNFPNLTCFFLQAIEKLPHYAFTIFFLRDSDWIFEEARLGIKIYVSKCVGGYIGFLLGAPRGFLGARFVFMAASNGNPNSQNVLFGHT